MKKTALAELRINQFKSRSECGDCKFAHYYVEDWLIPEDEPVIAFICTSATGCVMEVV